jgi:retinol dehydrogenase 12
VTDTSNRNVRNSYFSRSVLAYEQFLVLNIFFVRELTKRLPANSPVIVTAVNPGYCKSQLPRNLSPVHRMVSKIAEALIARTAEEGSRQLVWAAVGGVGREFELRGGYVSMANIQEVSDYALSDEGTVVQTRLWVF